MRKVNRKELLKIGLGAAAGGLTGIIFSGAPVKGLQYLAELTQRQYSPGRGQENYLKAVCLACRDKCVMTIRMINDRAVMINTSNSGCPFGQNALQLLYHPERVIYPLRRIGRKGSADPSVFEKVSWSAAIDDIASRIQRMMNDGKADLIAGINKTFNLSGDLLNRLLMSSGSSNVYYESSLYSLIKSTLGGYLSYDFTKADLVLSFGARLLEGWGNQDLTHKGFLEWKKSGAVFIQADAICTRTASMADKWLNIKPGTEFALASGIAWFLIRKKGKTKYNNELKEIIDKYNPEKAARITGVPAKEIKKIADAFYSAKNPVAVAGRGGKAVSSSSLEISLVNLLNSIADSKAVTLFDVPSFGYEKKPIVSSQKNKHYAGLDDFIRNGNFEMLFVNEADPVYKSVSGRDLSEKMKGAFVVGLMPLLNDTAMFADYIFPVVTFPEEKIRESSAELADYVNTKHAGDVIISIAGKISDIKSNFPWNNYPDALMSVENLVKSRINPQAGTRKYYNQLKVLENTIIPSSDYPLNLLQIEFTPVGDGDGMAFPYVLKTIDGKTYSDGKLWIKMNKITARQYGINEGDKIRIESHRGRLGPVRVNITDIVPPDTVAVPAGFGHKAYTKYAKNKGVNPKTIMDDEIDPVTGFSNWWLTKVRIIT